MRMIAPGVYLKDISHAMLGKNPNRQGKTRIDRLYVHHSGALGRSGEAGAIAASRYVVDGRGFPGMPYTFWLPHEADRQAGADTLTLYRCVSDDRRSWHTGGRANNRGVALAVQGNTSIDGISSHQEELLEAFFPWAFSHYGWSWDPAHIETHSENGKKTCPGAQADLFVNSYRKRMGKPQSRHRQ